MSDAGLMFGLHEHRQAHIPEGLHCHLPDNMKNYRTPFRADQKAPPITLYFYIEMCQLTTPINCKIHGVRLENTQIEVKMILKQRPNLHL